MQHSYADVIRHLLISFALGTDPDDGSTWPVYATGEPSLPDNCITVTDTQGTDDGRDMNSGELFGHVGFQVRVRSSDHHTGWQKTDAIQTFFAEDVYQETVTIDGVAYAIHCIAGIGDVLVLGKESPTSKRSLFTLNATASIREV